MEPSTLQWPKARFGFTDVMTEVRRLAFENPDYVYSPTGTSQMCWYQPTDERKACIFGQAFTNLGYEWPQDFETDTGSTTICSLFVYVGIELTDVQSRWATVLQRAQDAKEPWAKCVSRADRVIVKDVLRN